MRDRNYWPALILLCLLWVVLWWLAFGAWGQTVNRQEQQKFCSNLYFFVGETTKSNVMRLRLMNVTGIVHSDKELARSRHIAQGFVHGAAFVLNMAPLKLGEQWIKDNDCERLLKAMQADTVN